MEPFRAAHIFKAVPIKVFRMFYNVKASAESTSAAYRELKKNAHVT